jgi:hypothetical protein
MLRRIETGELLHIARLEKAVFYLQKKIMELIDGNERIPCEFRFSVSINHYAKLIVSTTLNNEDQNGGEYRITGLSYAVELCETEHIVAVYETTTDVQDPSILVSELFRKMDRYDMKQLYYCIHCMDELVEKGKDCCDACEIYKITYSEICAICHDDDYASVASVWGKLECGHIFHKHCVLQIKCHVEKRIKCPLCRHDQAKIAVAVI